MLEVGGLRGGTQVCRMLPAGAGTRASALSDGAVEPSDEGATRRTETRWRLFSYKHGTRRAVRVALSAGAKRLWKSRARKVPAGRGTFAPSCFRRPHPDRTPGPLGGNMLIRLALASL